MSSGSTQKVLIERGNGPDRKALEKTAISSEHLGSWNRDTGVLLAYPFKERMSGELGAEMGPADLQRGPGDTGTAVNSLACHLPPV